MTDAFRGSSLRRSESLPVFNGSNEGLYHFGLVIITIELDELLQPGVIASVVKRRLGRIFGISTQVAKVLHQHERAIELGVGQVLVLRYQSHR